MAEEMPESEFWVQEVSSPSQEALEGELGWEGVFAPPYCQHSPQSKGPRNQVNPIFIHFLYLLTYLLIYSCVHHAWVKGREQPWMEILVFYLVWQMGFCVFSMVRWPTSFYGDSPFSTFRLPRKNSRCIPCPALYGHWDPGAGPDACFTHGASLLAYDGHLHLYSVYLLVGS